MSLFNFLRTKKNLLDELNAYRELSAAQAAYNATVEARLQRYVRDHATLAAMLGCEPHSTYVNEEFERQVSMNTKLLRFVRKLADGMTTDPNTQTMAANLRKELFP